MVKIFGSKKGRASPLYQICIFINYIFHGLSYPSVSKKDFSLSFLSSIFLLHSPLWLIRNQNAATRQFFIRIIFLSLFTSSVSLILSIFVFSSFFVAFREVVFLFPLSFLLVFPVLRSTAFRSLLISVSEPDLTPFLQSRYKRIAD